MEEQEIIRNKQLFKDACEVNIHREGLTRLLAYLDKTDFYVAPSSASYHLNEAGGLCKHSLNVFEIMQTLYASVVQPVLSRPETPFSDEISLESIAITALFHDLCKVKMYKPSERWAKDGNGHWYSYPSYEFQDEFPFGHGEKSCVIVGWFIPLRQEELLAIRWHMGMFDMGEAGSSSRFAYRAAMEKSPLVALLQAADMLSANCWERVTKWK